MCDFQITRGKCVSSQLSRSSYSSVTWMMAPSGWHAREPCCCSEGPAQAGGFGQEGPREVQQGQVQRPGCSPLSPLLWQALGHTCLGDPQGWRLHHLSGQPVCFLSLFSAFIPIVPVLPQLLPCVINPYKQRTTAAEARNIHRALQRALTSQPGALSGNK